MQIRLRSTFILHRKFWRGLYSFLFILSFLYLGKLLESFWFFQCLSWILSRRLASNDMQISRFFCFALLLDSVTRYWRRFVFLIFIFVWKYELAWLGTFMSFLLRFWLLFINTFIFSLFQYWFLTICRGYSLSLFLLRMFFWSWSFLFDILILWFFFFSWWISGLNFIKLLLNLSHLSLIRTILRVFT